MKLSKEIVYYQLSKKYPVGYLSEVGEPKKYDRPILYDGTAVPAGFTVIIGGDRLAALARHGIQSSDNLFICVGDMLKTGETLACPIIQINAVTTLPEVLNYLQRTYLLFDTWDEDLKACCYEKGSYADLISCSEAIIYNPISIVDKEFHFVAFSKTSETSELLDSHDAAGNLAIEFVNNILTNSAYSDTFTIKEAYQFTYPVTEKEGLCKNIFYQGEYVGRFNVQSPYSDKHLCRYYSAILNHLCIYTEKLYEKYQSFTLSEVIPNSLRTQLINGLSGRELTKEQWKMVVRETGWGEQDELQMVQIRPNARYDKNTYAKYMGVELERKWHGCVCFEFNGRLMLLVNRDKFNSLERMSFNQSLAYFLRDSLQVAGLSRPFREIMYLNSAYEQTETALEYGTRLTPTLWYFSFDNYALPYMLKNSQGAYETERVCSEKLLILLKHDAEKKTEYFKTLHTYFECRLNATASAQKLFIQRSSFLYRMNRIQELVHINFDSNDELLYLAMSFGILRARGRYD